jgi:4-alpha-glucanotransferase
MEAIAERAAQWGIDTEYTDALGNQKVVDPDALAKIVEAVAADRDPPKPGTVPPVVVVRSGRDARLDVSAVSKPFVIRWDITADGATVAGGSCHAEPCRLPDSLPFGTYRLRLQVSSPAGDRSERAVLLAAPERAYQGDASGRLWAIAVQLYGVRSRRNWGIGDFTDLEQLIETAAGAGAAGIGLNPLHALFDDRPEQASPYAPNTRLFLNTLYIDVNAVPEFPGLRAAGVEQEVRRLRGTELVDYAGVASVKLKGLRLAYVNFREQAQGARRRDFEAFRQEMGEALTRFACFEVLRRRFPQVWWEWPAEWRTPNAETLERLRLAEPEEVGFYEYVQWIADRQLGACQAKARGCGMPIGLYIDLAVGVDAGGADAWSEQSAILSSLSVGAPPDLLNTAGQNWGLAGFNPAELAAQAFEPFRRMLRSAMRHAGAVRLDHILGLKRLYLIPHGLDPKQGAYLRFPLDGMLAVAAQESVRGRCIVIGEDLGTVPPGFRETLADWGIWSYLVMLFERGQDGSFHPPEHYPANALATFSTHDLPTFAGWASGHDLAVKRALDIDPGETDQERDRARTAFQQALDRRGLAHDPGGDFVAATRYLAATPSRLLVVSMEDILGVADQPNVPGTVTEHPNWRRRLPVLLEDLAEDARLRELGRVMAEAERAVAGAQP